MKDCINWIKGIISYTVIVGVPIIAIGAISASAYSVGHKDGMEDGSMMAADVLKKSIDEKESEKTEEE